MRRVYEHVGACPIRVTGLGWVRPGAPGASPPVFVCEMDPDEEIWFRKINAIRVVRDATDADATSEGNIETSHAPEEWTRQERARLAGERQGGRGRGRRTRR